MPDHYVYPWLVHYCSWTWPYHVWTVPTATVATSVTCVPTVSTATRWGNTVTRRRAKSATATETWIRMPSETATREWRLNAAASAVTDLHHAGMSHLIGCLFINSTCTGFPTDMHWPICKLASRYSSVGLLDISYNILRGYLLSRTSFCYRQLTRNYWPLSGLGSCPLLQGQNLHKFQWNLALDFQSFTSYITIQTISHHRC